MTHGAGGVPARMRAVLIEKYGGPEVLVVREVPVPALTDRQVLVAMAATSVNGGDLSIRNGDVAVITGRRFPKGLGQDVVGTVVALGPGASRWRTGDAVWGVAVANPRKAFGLGAYAEYVAAPEDSLGRVPSNLDLVEAAALPVVGTTALFAVDRVAGVRAGQRMLVRGAGGGVGTAVTQLAIARGADVTALARAGFHHEGVTALDYRAWPLERVRDRFDVIIDTVGSKLRTLRRLAPRGTTATITLSPVLPAAADLLLSGFHGRHRVRFSWNIPKHAAMERLRVAVENGEIRPVVQSTYALEDIAQAHRDAGAGTLGKRVVRIA